ncbi:pyridoxal-dependent decarboxylase, exosortase A system-associated [Sphingomonas sp. HDW15A]|uniref:pyridoxal-dependent decarboxylase, exosortase A system-associated n=1 Tax=Sphingomonas sp. HDW15A TaxID=2714942 RepID=UPI00140AF9B4|nr:pyridoxal-dependent decarboxylase, exosortase A system-associated [Sphingomonas sp. HDW15A]QIK96183.1 pyridoxal-dependent decarboxylase, exosortase A system-associated [Sphingomonas sp. HDW15A]
MKAMGPIPGGFEAGADGSLAIAGTAAEALVELAGGTPLFVYDRQRIGEKVARFRAAMPDNVALHYAVKANPYPSLLTWLASHVDGFDLASGGELLTLEEAGGLACPVSFAGPGKGDWELELAIERGVTINLESEAEAARAIAIADRLGVQPKLAIRVNPPFALKGAGMKMGGLASPFGVDSERVPTLARRIADAGAEWRGLHVYAGSQVLRADAIIEMQRATVALAAEIAGSSGLPIPHLNLGGGFGIPYASGDEPLDLDRVGSALRDTLLDAPDVLNETRYAIELGRWLVGEAGVYLARVVDVKQSGGRTFAITDGGLHHVLAASGNFGQTLRRNYPIANASRFALRSSQVVTVTGCLCTPLDLLGDEVMMPGTRVGDLIAIFCAGAYGKSASPAGFLSQPDARELLV